MQKLSALPLFLIFNVVIIHYGCHSIWLEQSSEALYLAPFSFKSDNLSFNQNFTHLTEDAFFASSFSEVLRRDKEHFHQRNPGRCRNTTLFFIPDHSHQNNLGVDVNDKNPTTKKSSKKKFDRKNIVTALEASSHSLLLRGMMGFSKVFHSLGLSRDCVRQWRPTIMEILNEFCLRVLQKTNHPTEFTWKWQVSITANFFDSLREISSYCSGDLEQLPMIRVPDAQYLVNHLDSGLIDYIISKMQRATIILNSLKISKMKKSLPQICEQLLQVRSNDNAVSLCVTAIRAATGIITARIARTEGKLRRKRFLPFVDDLTLTDIARDDGTYMQDTEVFFIDTYDSDKDLKFFYPLKLVLGFFIYGLIGCLAYSIYFMPLKGPKGPTGEKGWKGWKGYQGRPGQHGDNGERGDIGMKGLKGRKGWMGLRGMAGDDGHKGDRGPRGDKGSKGKKGKKGSKGKPGIVLHGDIGSKGEQGLPGPPGNEGYEIQIQGKKPQKHEDVVTEEKNVTHHHKHHHYHSHSHEHHHDSAIEFSAREEPSPLINTEGNDAIQRETAVFTHHVLLGKNEAGDVESLTGEEITSLINSQLRLETRNPAVVEVLKYPQARVLVPSMHQNFSANGLPNLELYNKNTLNTNLNLNIFNPKSLKSKNVEKTFGVSLELNQNQKTKNTWIEVQDKMLEKQENPRLLGDMAHLQTPSDLSALDINDSTDMNNETKILRISERNNLSNYISKARLLRPNGTRNTPQSGLPKFGRRRITAGKKNTRQRRNTKGEYLPFLEEALQTKSARITGARRSETEGKKELLQSVNALWRESKSPLGCVRCLLFHYLEKQPVTTLDSFIIAGFAHVLGDTESLQLLDLVRLAKKRGASVRCEKAGRTCKFKEL